MLEEAILYGSNYKSIVTHFNVPSMFSNVFPMCFMHIENRAHWRHIGGGGAVPNVL